ncbi:MAG TPA: alpha/beta hydrolase [Streptosporangiaceae bacterium]|nr:alpha/beta hydrolase [Streptosporangiaceae bacterium]
MQSERFLVECAGQQISIAGAVRKSGGHLIACLHGWGCAKDCFADIFDCVALQQMTVLALDFPGHGESDRLPDASLYSLPVFADIANAVIDLFDPALVSFVGHSMGGAVSLIASQARRDIYGIVDADGNLVAQDCGIVSRDTASQALDRFRRRGYQEFLDRLAESDGQDAKAWASWYQQADPTALHELARSLVEWSDSGKLLDLLKAQPRAAYLYGDQDSKDYLLPELSAMDTRLIGGSGHFMMLDNPVAFYNAISEFFAA